MKLGLFKRNKFSRLWSPAGNSKNFPRFTLHVSRFILLVGVLVILPTTYYLLPTDLTFAFIGPVSVPGVGTGAVGVDNSYIRSVGTSSPIADSKLFIVASSSASTGFAIMVVQPVATTTNDSGNTNLTPLFVVRNDARIGIGGPINAPGNDGARVVIHGPAVRVLGVIQPDSITGTMSAGNISSGFFGSNTGGGNYSFPAKLSVGTCTPPTTANSLYVVGSVGIGTASPASPLHITSGSGVMARLTSTGTGASYLQFQNS